MFHAESKLHLPFYMHVERTGRFFCYGQFYARIGTKSSRITNVWSKINLNVQHLIHHHSIVFTGIASSILGPSQLSMMDQMTSKRNVTTCPNGKYYQMSKAYYISIEQAEYPVLRTWELNQVHIWCT